MMLPGNPPADVPALRAHRRRGAVGVLELVDWAVFAAVGTTTPVLCRVVYQRLPLSRCWAGRDARAGGDHHDVTGSAPRGGRYIPEDARAPAGGRRGEGRRWECKVCAGSDRRLLHGATFHVSVNARSR